MDSCREESHGLFWRNVVLKKKKKNWSRRYLSRYSIFQICLILSVMSLTYKNCTCNDNQISENRISMDPRNILSIEHLKFFSGPDSRVRLFRQTDISETDSVSIIRVLTWLNMRTFRSCAQAWGPYLCGSLIWPGERDGVLLWKYGLLVPPNAAASPTAFRWIRTSSKLQNLQPYILNIGVQGYSKCLSGF
jgi:hypothetical protein